MKIKMLKNLSGTVDGKRIEPLNAGQIIDIDSDTAKKYVNSGLAENYKSQIEQKEVVNIERKDINL